MIWTNRQRTDATLRKLTYNNGTTENIHIEDIPENILVNGTSVNDANMNVIEKNIGTYGNDTFDNTQSYEVGDTFTYQGLLYRVTESFTGDFDNSKVEQFSLKEAIEENKEAIESKSSLPSGGVLNQVLTKKSNADDDAEWKYIGDVSIAGDTLPIGAIMPYPSNTIPTNWLICDGSAISRTTYADLFNVIGTTYGVGDGSTTFNLPDLKGKVPVGLDSNDTDFDNLGETGGEKTHTLTINEMPRHNHEIGYDLRQDASSFANTNSLAFATGGSIREASIKTSYAGETQAHNNLQPYIVQNYIIKAFQSSGLVANVVQAKSNSTTDVYSCDYVNNKLSYSATEKVVGEWIDGKPLYRKVVDLGALPNNDTKAVAHGIQSLRRIVKLEGFAGSSLNKGGITLPHGTSTPVALYADDTNVSVKTTSDATGYTEAYAFVYYTKTTD